MFREFIVIADDSAEYVRYKDEALKVEEEALRKRLLTIEKERAELTDIMTRLDEYKVSGNQYLCPVCYVGRGRSVDTALIRSCANVNVFRCPDCDLETEVGAQ